MKTILLIILAYCSFNFCLSQSSVPDTDYGDFVSANLKLRDMLTIKRYEFIYWKTPHVLRINAKAKFKPSDLSSPINVLSSFINCNDSEWFEKLYESNNHGYDLTTFFKNKDKVKSKRAKLLSKFEFTWEGNTYNIATIRTNVLNGENKIFCFLLKQINKNQWKISLEQPLGSLTSYFFLKPEITQAILLGTYINKYPKQYSDCFNSFLNNYNVLLEDGYLGMNIWNIMKGQKDFPLLNDMLIPNEDNISIKKDIEVYDAFNNKATGNGDIGKELNYSVRSPYQYLKLYKYNTTLANSDLGFSYCYSHDESINVYDSIPEMALVSWLFTSNYQERFDKSIGLEKFQKEMNQYDSIKQSLKRIEWSKYKVIFHHDSTKYAYLQFSEWSCDSNVDFTDGCNEKWLADKSVLLKWDTNQWKVVLDLNHELMPFIREIERLNYTGVELFLSGEWTKLSKDGLGYQYFANKSINSFLENKVYMNLLSNQPSSIYIDRTVPKQYRAGLGVRGIFDRGRIDDVLPYWMDRNR